MRSNGSYRHAFLLAGALLAVSGCVMHTAGCWPQVKAERVVELDRPLETGATLAVSTASGSIEVEGREVDSVHVVATICARASTAEEAQELAEQVDVRFEQSGDKVEIKADRPRQRARQSISISYHVVTPHETHIQCNSASGSLRVGDLIGNIDAHAASGSVNATNIQGSVRLRSASGSVRCESLRDGNAHLSSASGPVELSNASGIGTCDMSAASGSVVARQIEAESIKMRSASGPARLTDAQAQTMNLHSGSGGGSGRSIHCANLKAKSVSGSVSVTFSESTPADLVAEMGSGSGSVSVTVPPSFAGQVDLSVGSGSIHTDLPLTIQGKISKKRISGTLGQGTGHLAARTGSGSIRVK